MNIIKNGIRNIDPEKQVVFFTLTDNIPTEYRWHGNTPVFDGQLLQDYLDNKLESWLLLIRKREYPGAKYQDSAGDTDLEKFEQWIADGHTNPDGVVDKVPFKDSWSASKVQAEQDMKQSIFYNKTNQQIQDYLTNNVKTLNDVLQYLYRLTINQRNMERRQGWEDES